MQIPLNHFEQHIDGTILKRGLSYFKKGNVNQFDEMVPGEFEAIVEGTDDYTVRLKVKNNVVTEYSCTCPYDYGSVCKHVVAVFFYMQQEELDLQSSRKKKKETGNRPAAKKKTVAEQIDGLLAKLSHDDLKQFVKDQSNANSTFRQMFLSVFAHKTSGESQAMYKQQINSVLRAAKGRDGYIDWSGVRMVGNAVNDLLVTAKKHVESQNYQSAVFICLAVLEEMIEAINNTDDSNGDLGGNIETAFEMLGHIALAKLPEPVRLHLLENCKNLHNKGSFSGWGWHITFLQIASQLITSEKEAEAIFVMLEKSQRSEFDREHAVEVKYELIKKIKGNTEAEKFMGQNLNNPAIRRMAIEKAIADKNFDKAIYIARDGINFDTKDKPGLALEWYDWLLRVVLIQKNTTQIIEYARFLFIDGFRHDQDYYGILKKHIEPAKWNNFVETLVDEIKKKGRWSNIDVIGKIYVDEKWLDKLLLLLQQNPSPNYIQHYEQYLSKDYPDELAALYELSVFELLKRATGRNHYQEACRYMRRMIKLGAREKVNKMIDSLRKQYPQRKALMEELSLI